MKTLVNFKNGKYAVRIGNWFIGYRYLDLVGTTMNYISWTRLSSRFFHDCLGTKEEACKAFNFKVDFGTKDTCD